MEISCYTCGVHCERIYCGFCLGQTQNHFYCPDHSTTLQHRGGGMRYEACPECRDLMMRIGDWVEAPLDIRVE
jgi:hypothetical protein